MSEKAMEAVRSRFDQVAAGWDANPGRVAMAKGIVAAMRAAVPLRADMEVMDFGAGTGLVTLGLLPHVARVTAVDASPGMLRMLEEKLQALGITNVQTLAGDIAQTHFPAAAFDVIVSSMVLHHIPDVPAALQRLRPCLRRGGWLALADLIKEDGSFHADPKGVFHNGFDPAEIGRWLEAAGFTEIVVGEAHRITREAEGGRTREYPVFLVTARAG
ncbi:MAG: class I SAM-dependent methyltransferase [Lentisphaerae bacterium]|nr:class I SAM-dependent methyltransferase [Lentisphaerota bacterium]